MGRIPDNLSLKRKRPDDKSGGQNLPDNERVLYDQIRSKEDMGIWTKDLKKEVNLPDTVFNKALKSLKDKNLIKDVVNIKNKGKKYVMAVEFEPSNELTGGQWYVDGKLDTEFILILKGLCKNIVKKDGGPYTIESITENVNRSGAFTNQYSTMQISQIIKSLVLENEVMEVKSAGILCYRSIQKGGVSKVGAMASIPCGVCPHINDCTPDGIISPTTCVYYKKWLTF